MGEWITNRVPIPGLENNFVMRYYEGTGSLASGPTGAYCGQVEFLTQLVFVTFLFDASLAKATFKVNGDMHVSNCEFSYNYEDGQVKFSNPGPCLLKVAKEKTGGVLPVLKYNAETATVHVTVNNVITSYLPNMVTSAVNSIFGSDIGKIEFDVQHCDRTNLEQAKYVHSFAYTFPEPTDNPFPADILAGAAAPMNVNDIPDMLKAIEADNAFKESLKESGIAGMSGIQVNGIDIDIHDPEPFDMAKFEQEQEFAVEQDYETEPVAEEDVAMEGEYLEVDANDDATFAEHDEL